MKSRDNAYNAADFEMPNMTNLLPEQKARVNIDSLLAISGWEIQNVDDANIRSSLGVAIREYPLKNGHGFADYLLYVDGKAIGVIEAKKEGVSLTGVETQSDKYKEGLPENIPSFERPLPFSYQSTGIETRFTNHLEPDAKSRQVFTFHTPEFLLELALKPEQALSLVRNMPEIDAGALWPAQLEAIRNLEVSLKDNRSRSLIQMATGSGKTFTAVNFVYRLVKYGGAKRILFLVDRGNLGRQTLTEFQQFETPDDGRKFTEIYNVQHLKSNKIDDVSKVTISTIQRMFSMLSWKEIQEEDEEQSMFDLTDLYKESELIKYNPNFPIDAFDYIVVDECHRSIYNLWRQILEYFDAKIIGLTATPSKQTIGFFHNNLVMEYNHERAVADGVNADFSVYKIETAITKSGSKVEAGYYIDKRDRQTRKILCEQLDNDLMYDAKDLDRSVVAEDQIRTVVRTFKEHLFTDIFPWRTDVPKTLIFAKDDNHAEDIVKIVRDEFGKGNDFCQKITYKTTGKKPEDLIQEFRNSYNPRIAVTVDMIATGTDIKPLEVVFFLRTVKSQLLFEQMKGRGVRVINDTDFQKVTVDSKRKTHFVIVDAVGACELDKTSTKPLEKKPMIAFERIIQAVSLGNTEPDVISTLVSRLSRISKSLTKNQEQELKEIAGIGIHEIENNLVRAIDPDFIEERAQVLCGKEIPDDITLEKAQKELAIEALGPFYDPKFRKRLLEMKSDNEQIVDNVSQDQVLFTGFSEEAKDKAQGIIQTFEKFLIENKEELALIKAFYEKSYREKVKFEDVKKFVTRIESNPILKDQKNIWRAYRTLNPGKVIDESKYANTDFISLIQFTAHSVDLLQPYRYSVTERFSEWLGDKSDAGVRYTSEQTEWLELIKDQIANSLEISKEDFERWHLAQKWGLWGFYKAFGENLDTVLKDLNENLVSK